MKAFDARRTGIAQTEPEAPDAFTTCDPSINIVDKIETKKPSILQGQEPVFPSSN